MKEHGFLLASYTL